MRLDRGGDRPGPAPSQRRPRPAIGHLGNESTRAPDADAIRDDAGRAESRRRPHTWATALEREGQVWSSRRAWRAASADVFRGGDADVGVLEARATLLVFVPAGARESTRATRARPPRSTEERSAKRDRDLHLQRRRRSVEPRRSLTRSAEAARSGAGDRPPRARRRATSRRTMRSAPTRCSTKAPIFTACQTSREASSPRCASTTTRHQTKLEADVRLFFETGRERENGGVVSTCTGIPSFYRLRQIGEIARARWKALHDNSPTLAVAIDARPLLVTTGARRRNATS